MKSTVEAVTTASPALLSAALGGLLLLAPACGSTDASSGGASGTAADGGSAASTTTSPSDAGTSIVSTTPNGDTPTPDLGCNAGVLANPTVTSRTVGPVSQAQFASDCAAKNGIFETQPHCGGSNACRGMSYDSETQTLTEHTCRATNSCAGFSCVVCD